MVSEVQKGVCNLKTPKHGFEKESRAKTTKPTDTSLKRSNPGTLCTKQISTCFFVAQTSRYQGERAPRNSGPKMDTGIPH